MRRLASFVFGIVEAGPLCAATWCARSRRCLGPLRRFRAALPDRANAETKARLMPREPLLHPDDAQRRPTPRRGLSLAESADYIGVSVTKFLEMVGDGRMPSAKEIDRRRVYDIRALDRAFDALPGGEFDEEAALTQPPRKIVL